LAYVQGFSTWIDSMAGKVAEKDLDPKTVEGKGGHLAVIIELSFKEVAVEAYERANYQELSKLRWANSTDTNITIIAGSATL